MSDQATRCLAGDDLDAWLSSFEDTKAALIEAEEEIERLRRIEVAARAVLADLPWARTFDGREWRDHPAKALREALGRG